MREEDKRILEGLIGKYGKQDVINFIKKGKYNLGKAVAIGALGLGSIVPTVNYYKDINKSSEEIENSIMTQLPANFDEKVEAVKEYIKYALNNQKYKYDDLKLSPEALVLAAYENDFDLPMMLAQAHQESCFGMTPRARRTNSVFSVGLYDSGKNACTYDTQDDSIQSYIDLLKNDYMLDGKSELDLLKPKAFVNYRGHRYAQDPNYEKYINNIRNRIIRMFPILEN